MKKIIATLLLIAGACSLTKAQAQVQVQVNGGQTEFGLGIGYGGAYIINSSTYSISDPINAVNFFASADHYFSNRWSLKAKVVYDQKGWKGGYTVTSANQSITTVINFKYTYITVPVMANWHFGKTRNWYLNFGPYAGFLLKKEGENYNPGRIVQVIYQSNTIDGGLALGVGVKIPLSDKLRLFIEYDGQSGAVNVYKNSNTSAQIGRASFNIGLNF